MPQREPRRSDRPPTRIGSLTDLGDPFLVNVSDRGDEFLVSADLPGLEKQDIDVTVERDRLQIVADFGTDEAEGGTYHRKERERGRARRVVHLPDPVDEKHVSASYTDGILWVTLRKRERPKRIEVE
ncbi:Hsp20/alpha crystallin family protein [Haloarchaeobius sp. HRN-SO-5]|uniref:Hsp20/alpha crystallin family protein n=1 Tax=Haloarchaeobius sp. HRN-SO-5 TaxID=3446118 RepID=UPI003EBCC801